MSKSKIITVITVFLLFLSWSYYAEYDLNQWDQDQRRGLIMLHQFDSIDVPMLQDNEKCIKDGLLVFQYHQENALFRCGSLYWPLYDEITVDKALVEKAFEISFKKD